MFVRHLPNAGDSGILDFRELIHGTHDGRNVMYTWSNWSRNLKPDPIVDSDVSPVMGRVPPRLRVSHLSVHVVPFKVRLEDPIRHNALHRTSTARWPQSTGNCRQSAVSVRCRRPQVDVNVQPACRAASGTRSRALARPDSGMSAWASLSKAADSSPRQADDACHNGPHAAAPARLGHGRIRHTGTTLGWE
jgi:hypothetical protein